MWLMCSSFHRLLHGRRQCNDCCYSNLLSVRVHTFHFNILHLKFKFHLLYLKKVVESLVQYVTVNLRLVLIVVLKWFPLAGSRTNQLITAKTRPMTAHVLNASFWLKQHKGTYELYGLCNTSTYYFSCIPTQCKHTSSRKCATFGLRNCWLLTFGTTCNTTFLLPTLEERWS
jgi:hypothetical protein